MIGYNMNMWGDHVWNGAIFVPFLIGIAVLSLVLKGMALWRSAQAKDRNWFIAILILNTAGILPAIYLYINRDKKKSKKK